MNLLEAGIWPCTILTAAFGVTDKAAPRVQVNVRIDEGPSKGRQCSYEDDVTNKSALYVSRSVTSIGWKGKSLTTLTADVERWIKETGGKSTVEIKHIGIKQGKRTGQIWDKPNSIGRGPKVLAAAPTDALADADEAMRRALAADGGSTPGDGAPPDADDLPFARAHGAEPTAIARVLRGSL